MRNKSILTKAMRRLMLMVLLVTQVVMGTSSAFADTVTGSVTFDSSVWGTTNKQFDKGSTQTWTNYLTLTLNPVTAGDNCRISGGYLGLYHQSTLEITAPVGCTITGMTIAGSNYGGTPSTTPGSLTSEPGSTSYTWTGSSSSVTISTDAGERDSYDFQSIVVTYETSLDAMATTTSNGAIYSFNQNPNPFFGVSLYAKTITAGNQEMYFDAFGSDDPMIMQNLVDSSFYLHMPAQSRLRLQRSDSSSDIYITKAVFTFVSGSPSISPDGGTYNSSTHTWTGQESQIIFLFNEEADIQLIESEAGLVTASNHTVNITCGEYGTISGKVLDFTGTSTEEFQVTSGAVMPVSVPDGYSVELTFVPTEGYYLSSVMRDDVEDIVSFVEDGKITLTSITSDMSLNTTFSRMEMFLQIDSHTDFGSVNWQVTDVLAGDVITNGMVKNAVDDIPVPYGSTVQLTFAYDQTQYGLSQLTRNGADILTEVSENSYTITNYATNDTIVVDFVQLVSEPYAVLANDTVTFYYDTHKEERDGIVVINNSEITASPYGTATAAVFDASFADYLPTSTAYLFYKCSSLTSITNIEYLNTANVTDMSYMFAECSGLTSLTVSFLNTAKVTDMHNMFFGCSGLTGLDLSGFDTSATTTMASMFSDCTNLQEVMFGDNFNTANVTDMSWMFSGCASLTNLYGTWTDFNTAKVTNMTYMFSGCGSLTNLDVTHFSTANVTDMAYMFCNCINLTSLDLSSFNTAKVTDMSYMFVGCANLTTIYGGDGWTTASVTESSNMFKDCTNLVGGAGTIYDENHVDADYAHIDGGSSNPGYFTPKGDYVEAPTFAWNADDLTMTSGTEGATIYYTLTDAMTSTPTPTQYTAPITVTSDVLIEAYAEKDGMARSMTTVLDYPYSAWMQLVTAIADAQNVLAQATTNDNVTAEQRDSLVNFINTAQGMYEARIDSAAAITQFTTDLTTLTETVRQAVEAVAEPYAVLSDNGIFVDPETGDEITAKTLTFYYDKKKLERNGMDVGPFSTSGERGWDSQKTNITRVVFDESFVNCTTITSTANWFVDMSGLAVIEGIQYLNTQNVTNMSWMFGNCSDLTSLDLPSFNTQQVTDMYCMFSGCSGLASLNVSSFNTQNVTRMESMFFHCSGLTTLDLSSFNTANVTDMRQLFSGCSNLTTIYAGNGWNTEKIIDGSEMFAGCTVLVGGAGTTFDADHTDYTYAHIDGGESSPGYFTAAGEEPFQESKNWSVVGTLAGSSESGVTMIAIDETNYTATFTLLPAGVYEYKVRDDNNIDRTYGQPDGSDVTVTVPEDNYSVTILFNAKTKAVSHELAEPIYSVIGFTSADGSGRSEFVMQRDSVGVPYTVGTSVSMGTRTFKISINHEDSVYYGKKGQLKGEPIAFYTPMAGMNVTFYFDPVTKLATTSVGIIKDKYAVHVSVAGNGSVVATETDDTGTEQSSTIVNGTSEEDVEVTEDNTLTLTLQPADGNHLVSLIVDGVDVTSQIEDNKYMLPAIAETHTVSVTYVQNDLEPYAVLSEENTRLTFYYDSQKESRGGISFQSGTNVYWPSSITSVTTVSFDESFAGFLPTSTSSWFAGFNSLTSIEGMEYLNTTNVTSMISMFQYCENLTALDLSGLQTGNVETMTNMFYGCQKLANLNISGFNTANVTSLASMFYGCQSLTTIDLSSFNTSNVTRMEEMFQDCVGLTTLDLSMFNTGNVENMSLMFVGCTNLATIYAGSGWSVAKVTDSNQMFYDCYALVGGQGTVYDADHTDYTYAHIDGGTSNPGYFSLKLAMGDANGDGNINIADAVATVTNILGQPTEAAFYKYAADMNTDQVIDIFDVTMIVNAAFEAASPAPAVTRGSADNIMTENISMTADADYIYLGVDQPERFTATQFDVTLPEGMELVDARLASATTDHQLSFVKRGDSQYRVIALSMNNEVFRSAHGHLIQLQVSNNIGENNVKMSDVLFVNPSGKTVTGISEHLNATMAADDSIYDLNGRYVGNDRRQLSKGIYIINHKKVNIK